MLIVCLNPTMDRQIFLSELHPGSVMRASSNRRLAGGKPIDVCRAMAAHSAAPQLLITLPAASEDYADLLAAEGLAASMLPVPGELRQTIVVYEDSGRSTVINGRGAAVDPPTWQTISTELRRRAAEHDWVVLSGSFPPGVTDDDVRTLVSDLHASGTRVALDTGPDWLRAALPARPDLITPNLAEAQQLSSSGPAVEAVEFGEQALAEAETAARALAGTGIPYTVVTAGSTGAAWATTDDSGTQTALPVDTVNPIGAGDAFLGGVLAHIDDGTGFADAVAWGVATAASAVLHSIPGQADATQVRTFRGRLA